LQRPPGGGSNDSNIKQEWDFQMRRRISFSIHKMARAFNFSCDIDDLK